MKKAKLTWIVVCALVWIFVLGYLYWDHYMNCPSWAETIMAALTMQRTQAENEFRATGDLNTYIIRMQAIDQDFASLPKPCQQQLLGPQPVPSQTKIAPCPQLWSNYDQCLEDRKKDIILGKPTRNCWEPSCPRY